MWPLYSHLPCLQACGPLPRGRGGRTLEAWVTGGVSGMGAPTPEAGVVPADGPDVPGVSPLSGLGRARLHGPESL